MPHPLRFVAALLVVGGLTACGGDDKLAGSGLVSLDITEIPTGDFSRMVVSFNRVIIKPVGGAPIRIDIDKKRVLDLLESPTGKTAALLTDEVVPAGKYEWIRLVMNADSSYVTDANGHQKALFMPFGEQTDIKLIRGFSITEDGQSRFTIRIDVHKSIVNANGPNTDYFLKPTLRIVDTNDLT